MMVYSLWFLPSWFIESPFSRKWLPSLPLLGEGENIFGRDRLKSVPVKISIKSKVSITMIKRERAAARSYSFNKISASS